MKKSKAFTPLNSRKTNSTGFTLIELLVVVAIIGIIATIAVVATRGVIGRARIARTLQSEASMHRYLGMDIVGWWKFDGDLKDISGYNNHGKWKGTDDPVPSEKWVDGVPGKGGSALEFDGSGDYVGRITSENDILDIKDQVSIFAWVMPLSYVRFNYIVSKNLGGGYSDQQYGLTMENDNLLVVTIDGNSYKHSYNWIMNNWVYVGFIWNGSKIKTYINGDFLNESSHISQPSFKPHFSIGRRSNSVNGISSAYLFNGKISDVRIYNRALISREIEKLYAETKHKYIAENNNKEK